MVGLWVAAVERRNLVRVTPIGETPAASTVLPAHRCNQDRSRRVVLEKRDAERGLLIR
jgi:hypothetical protein